MQSKLMIILLVMVLTLGCSKTRRTYITNVSSSPSDKVASEDPYCTNHTVYLDHEGDSGELILEPLGFYKDYSAEGVEFYGSRWCLKNETSEEVVVSYYSYRDKCFKFGGELKLPPGSLVLFTSEILLDLVGDTKLLLYLEGNLEAKVEQSSEFKDLKACREES